MKNLSRLSRLGIWISIFINIVGITLVILWCIEDENEDSSSNIEQTSLSLDVYSHEGAKSDKGHGWLYWLMAGVVSILAFLMVMALGPVFGFILFVGAMFFILLICVSTELGFVLSLPVLLAYLMDK